MIKRKFSILALSLILFISGCNSNSNKTSEILWDNYGVPHIFAKDYNELFYLFGWAQMRNHANLMLRLFAQSRGRAAEYYGKKHVDSDKWVHTHNIPNRAEDWLELQNPTFKRYFESFVNGINDYANNFPDDIDIRGEVFISNKNSVSLAA